MTFWAPWGRAWGPWRVPSVSASPPESLTSCWVLLFCYCSVQVGYNDFVAAGSFNAAKEKGLVSASAWVWRFMTCLKR